MKISKSTRVLCVLGALWNIVLPFPVRADAPQQDQTRILDLQLDARRSLPGQYVDDKGNPKPRAQVQLWTGGKIVAVATTDDQGRFRFPAVKGGVYHVGTVDSRLVCRAWAPRTAPPQSQPSVLLVSGQDVLRGQRPFGEIVTNPLVIAVAIAAAIAIPIAIHNSGNDNNGS